MFIWIDSLVLLFSVFVWATSLVNQGFLGHLQMLGNRGEKTGHLIALCVCYWKFYLSFLKNPAVGLCAFDITKQI